MYVARASRAGTLGEAVLPPPPQNLPSYCQSYPNSEQCLHPSVVVTPIKQGIKRNWGILLGVALAGFVVYKVAS